MVPTTIVEGLAVRKPILHRFEITTLKRRSLNDPARIPAAATIAFYKQGATVSATAGVPPPSDPDNPVPTTISVYDTGSIRQNDVVLVDGDPTKPLQIATVFSSTSLAVIWSGASDITLFQGDRLIRNSDRPTAYVDPIGSTAVSGSSSITTPAATGFGACYLRERVFDYVVTIGSSRFVYPDTEGTFDQPFLTYLNAAQYPSIKAAVEALPLEGGTVYIPPGLYDLTPTTTPIDLIRPNTYLVGAGSDATIIQCPSGSSSPMIRVRADGCEVRGLALRQKPPLVAASGTGIDIGSTVASVGHTTLADLDIVALPGPGVRFGPSSTLGSHCSLVSNVRVRNSRSTAQVVLNSLDRLALFEACAFEASVFPDSLTPSPAGVRGVVITNSSTIRFESCTGIMALDTPWIEVLKSGPIDTWPAAIVVADCTVDGSGTANSFAVVADGVLQLVLRDNRIRLTQKGIRLLNCYHALVSGTLFRQVGSTADPQLQLDDSLHTTLLNNAYEDSDGDRMEIISTESNSPGTTSLNANCLRIPNRSSPPSVHLFPGVAYFDLTSDKLRFMISSGVWRAAPP